MLRRGLCVEVIVPLKPTNILPIDSSTNCDVIYPHMDELWLLTSYVYLHAPVSGSGKHSLSSPTLFTRAISKTETTLGRAVFSHASNSFESSWFLTPTPEIISLETCWSVYCTCRCGGCGFSFSGVYPSLREFLQDILRRNIFLKCLFESLIYNLQLRYSKNDFSINFQQRFMINVRLSCLPHLSNCLDFLSRISLSYFKANFSKIPLKFFSFCPAVIFQVAISFYFLYLWSFPFNADKLIFL